MWIYVRSKNAKRQLARTSLSASLVDEEEIASRNTEFQLINENQKRALHEHHVQKKKCCLSMREVFIDAFCMVFEHCCNTGYAVIRAMEQWEEKQI